ncbi:MAG: divalent-cation tolerance protein CutA [Saprospiraceae bacterium]
MQISIFYIPVGSIDTAQKIGKLAIELKLAGCANFFPIESIFPWEDAIQKESEFVLVLKTATYLKEKLSSFIQENHPYEIPCIMNWNVEVNQGYGEWIERNVISKSF